MLAQPTLEELMLRGDAVMADAAELVGTLRDNIEQAQQLQERAWELHDERLASERRFLPKTAYGNVRSYHQVEEAHILVVEDSAGDTLLIQQALASCPIPLKLHVARDGEQALQMLASLDVKPSLIILDLNMPRLGGFTFLQRYQPKDIPVVIFSISALDADKQYALELGASEYVEKPIELQDFADVVCRIVENWLGQKKETGTAVL